ncbi:unnamed protein product [Phytomonas sp. EM1]|nr:unnamed protein product [Phytomonas sp. EM1]|eukprot:CCW63493.1 unnamed protein product [Phytomonas sp. isolate EM1]
MLGAFGCCCASFNYAFNLISKPMRQRYNFTEREMGTIMTVGLVLKYVLTPYAYLYDRVGVLPITVIMTSYFVIGTACLAQCFAGNISGSVLKLSVFNAFLTCGGSLFDLVCCMTILNHFPSNKGAAAAFIKAFTGLGSALAGSLYTAFFMNRADLYFYFLMTFAAVVGTFFMIFVRQPPYYIMPYEQDRLSPEEIKARKDCKTAYLRQKPPVARFIYGFVIIFFLIVYLPISSTLVQYRHLSQPYKTAFAVVSIVAWLMVPLISVPFPGLNGPKALPGEQDQHKSGKVVETNSSVLPEESKYYLAKDTSVNALTQPDFQINNATDEPSEKAERSAPETDMDYIAPQYQHRFVRNLTTLELWGLWWTMFCCIGAQFIVIFNASQIYAALSGKEPSDALRAMLTVFNGVGGAVGRLLMAYFEIWSQKRKAEDRVPITISLFFPVVPTILTFVLFLILPVSALPLPYVVVALSNGFSVAVCVLLTRTIYARDSALHYNFCFIAVGASSVVFNRFLYAEWYAYQTEKRGNSSVCFDKACVLMPMIVLIALGCSALLSSFVVHIRYRTFYIHALKERARIRMAAMEDAGQRRPDQVNDALVHRDV